MFAGVRSHRDARRVTSYETAVEALERASKTPTGKRRTEKPYGFHLGMNRNHGVTWVRQGGDDIIFRLYDTDVVIWHPDNSVEIENYGTVTTRDFVSRFIPQGIGLRIAGSKQGEDYGDRCFTYYTTPRPADTGDWRDLRGYWASERICQGCGNTAIFREVDGTWQPDTDTLDPMTFLELDRKAAREISRRYPWKDMENWLAMAPRHMRIEHDCWDLDTCLEALEKRDFRVAAETLPTIVNKESYGRMPVALPIVMTHRDRVITMTSLAKLRKAAYAELGAYVRTTVPSLTVVEFTRRMGLIRELRALDVGDARNLGPDQ